MENNKKVWISRIITVAFAVALIFSLWEINDLKNQITNFEVNSLSRLSDLQNSINEIYSNIDERMKKEASIITSADYEVGELNTENNQAEIVFQVVPKEIEEKMNVTVKLGEKEYNLKREGSVFKGSMSVDIFGEYDFPIVTVKDAEKTKTEVLESVTIDWLWQRYLPCMNVTVNSYNYGNSKYEAEISIDYKPPYADDGFYFTEYSLVTEVDGKEVAREDITDKVLKNAELVKIERKTEKYDGDVTAVYVLGVDSLGFTHKCLADFWTDVDYETTDAFDGTEHIYDSKGNLLF